MKKTIMFFFFSFNMFSCFALESFNIDDLRFSIHPDLWDQARGYVLKGDFLRLSDSCKKDHAFWIFDNSQLKGKPFLKVYSQFNYQLGSKNCGLKNLPTIESSVFLACNKNSCIESSEDYSENVEMGRTLKLALLKNEYNNECPLKLDLTDGLKESSEDPNYTFFKFKNTDKELRYAELDTGKSVGYLDLTNCKSDSTSIGKEVVSIPSSRLEEDFKQLEKEKIEKKITSFNKAISLITPCLNNNDAACVRKFISQIPSDDELRPSTKITPEVMKELKKCLSYENLLPHLKASRGDKMVCIFNSDRAAEPIRSITYPEALSTNQIFRLPLTK